MEDRLKELEDKQKEAEEEDDKDETTQKSMTKQLGIFFMLYETKEKAGFTIFNEEGTSS
jgi:hypothetical protein